MINDRSFSEDTRVKIPAILTLTRLGYNYLSLKDRKDIDTETNIFVEIFNSSIKRLNPDIDAKELSMLLSNIRNDLNNDDLGEAFYKRLVNQVGTSSSPKLIDFANIENNDLNVVTELTYKNGEDEFRPDITLLINGMPLAFIEVKKPNNRDGILKERERINIRFQNEKFRRFINISQILVFSNNMPYDDADIDPIQGAFYSSTSKTKAFFNLFKEEPQNIVKLTTATEELDSITENFILQDTNYQSLKNSVEFETNKDLSTPTNSIILSLFSKNRIFDILKYAFAYVKYTDDEGKYHLEKHIMRYPQFFASKAIQNKLDTEVKKGIIWHTQGSGKTALAYFNVKWLTDYFQKKNIIPKFYFIVDRIDLRDQAASEFLKRGLKVNLIDSRANFVKDIQSPVSTSSLSGEQEITILNIQKFSDDAKALENTPYAINTQRVYFIDEAHRSYNPTGSFLGNLVNSDKNAIIISLTGTPLLKDWFKGVFGDYIHKYYYNQSISDGYTLKLIREDIETQYKDQLSKALADIEIQKGSMEEQEIYAHNKFITPMLEYIIKDLTKTRIRLNDNIGGMVVCNSSKQAKGLYELFKLKYENKPENEFSPIRASLILCDVADKQFRKEEVKDFKEGKVDILFVYNMLLTGFDAPRLKKLYLNREVKDHNLLQTLTRVNRPYKQLRYGYIVDFVNIKEQFDKANKAYWEELNDQLGNEAKHYSNLFKSTSEIETDITDIQNKLWRYDTSNLEEFRKQIDTIKDRKDLSEIKKVLEKAKELYNVIKFSNHTELLEKLDFSKFRKLLTIVSDRIGLLNIKESMEKNNNTSALLNEALENIVFQFIKIGEAELKLADDFRDTLKRTREAIVQNFDIKDPEFITLKEQLEQYFKNRDFEKITSEDMNKDISVLNKIYDAAIELNRKNAELQRKYDGDIKFARIHKAVIRDRLLDADEVKIFTVLNNIKHQIDEKLLQQDLLQNKNFFGKEVKRDVALGFGDIPFDTIDLIKDNIVKEYVNERAGIQW